MNSKKIITLTILTLMFLVNVNVLADEVPGTPHTFYGKVYQLGGSPAPAGLELVAKINNTEYGDTITSYGEYDFLIVTDPENKNQGQTIYFYVNGIQATPTYEFNRNEGLTELDLTLTSSLPTTTTTTTTVPSRPSGDGGRRVTTTTTTTTITTTTTLKPKARVNMDIENLIIPSDVTADEAFELGVVVKNTGDEEGTDDITIALPEDWKTDKWGERITLKPDETTILYFSITPSENSGEIAAGSSTDFEVSGMITPRVKAKPMPITGLFLTALTSIGYWWILIIIIIVLLIVFFVLEKPSKKPYKYKHKPKKR